MKRLIVMSSIGCFTAVSAGSVHAAVSLPGDVPLVTLAATGVQIYECRTNGTGALEWAFKEPRADLSEGGRVVGRHYGGPTWEFEDGSRIVGKVVDRQEGAEAGAIPWLRLSVVSRSGQGALSAVSTVVRTDTHGGALSGTCGKAGAVSEIPYTADYIMIGAPK